MFGLQWDPCIGEIEGGTLREDAIAIAYLTDNINESGVSASGVGFGENSSRKEPSDSRGLLMILHSYVLFCFATRDPIGLLRALFMMSMECRVARGWTMGRLRIAPGLSWLMGLGRRRHGSSTNVI
jgi:hypothetical protein